MTFMRAVWLGYLHLPALVIRRRHLLGWEGPLVQERRDQSVPLVAWTGGGVQGVLDHPHRNASETPESGVGRGVDRRQDRAVGQDLGGLEDQVGLRPAEVVRATGVCGAEHLERVDIAVPEPQQAGPDRAPQTSAGRGLGRAAGPEDHVAQGMRAGLDQRDHTHLGEATDPAPTARSTEGLEVGRGLGHLQGGAVHRHPPHAVQECTRRVRGSDRTSHRLEQHPEQARASPTAGADDGRRTRHLPPGACCRFAVTPALHHCGQGMPDGLGGPQPHRHHQHDHQTGRQPPPTLLPRARRLDRGFHQLVR
jgi:hypothetical protein